MMSQYYPLKYAADLADRLVGILRDGCERVAIAGSIRRKRSRVRDIDLVVMPTNVSRLAVELSRYGLILSKGRIDSSTKLIRFRFRGMPVDIYLADAETWPMILLVRTGSAQHNRKLATLARQKGLRFRANGKGITTPQGERISGDSEESIFEALDLEWIAPEERE